MEKLPVIRSDDVPDGTTYLMPHGSQAVDTRTGADKSLPPGIYTSAWDYRTDDEIRASFNIPTK